MSRLLKALGYSWAGLRAAFASEPAFRQEIALAVILIPLALWLDVSAVSKALMIGSIFLILIAELTNTAIEAVVDRISEESHPLSKKAKDVGSAMVLLALINAVCIWVLALL